MAELKEYRCYDCNKLLFRGTPGLDRLEIKCLRCRNINHFNKNNTGASKRAVIIGGRSYVRCK